MIDLSCIVLGINIFLTPFSFRQSKRSEMKDNNCPRYHTVPHYCLTAPLSGELVTKTILSSQYYKRRGRWFINGCKHKPSYNAEFQLWGTPFFFFSHYVDHRGRQNVVRTSVTHSAAPRVPLFCSYHILTSFVIYYWIDARQLGIYLLSISCGHRVVVWSPIRDTS